MVSSTNEDRWRRAYGFLKACLAKDRAFTLAELATCCDWKESTPKTYIGKQWKELVEAVGGGQYKVRQELARIDEAQFIRQGSQKKPIYTPYRRTKHDHVVMFEFLLPLTREDKLRDALDELFYSDSVAHRVREVGLDEMERVVPRPETAGDGEYVAAIVAEAEMFGGYSISHVRGRFRGAGLVTRQQAGDLLATGKRYLVDETTAVVRFIIPCGAGSSEFTERYGRDEAIHDDAEVEAGALQAEVRKIRGIFFLLFVEAVVRTVQGEDEIWLVESGVCHRVYRWSAAAGG